jgi:hypothetical protein
LCAQAYYGVHGGYKPTDSTHSGYARLMQDTSISRPVKKEKGEQEREKGTSTDNSYCRFPHNDYCRRKFSKVK